MGQGDLPLCNAAEVVKVLEHFGYAVNPRRGKGSHIVMEKPGAPTVAIPGHKPVKRVTLASILRAAGISIEAFRDAHKPRKGHKNR